IVPSLSQRREHVPKELEGIVARALAKHPNDRFASAADMRQALAGLATRTKKVPTRGICGECGTTCAPSFKFCPECGTPRQRVVRTFEATEPAPAPAPPTLSRILPLPFTCRDDELAQLLGHMRRSPGK